MLFTKKKQDEEEEVLKAFFIGSLFSTNFFPFLCAVCMDWTHHTYF